MSFWDGLHWKCPQCGTKQDKATAETRRLHDALDRERQTLRHAHDTIASAEEWAEEIQHAGYAVPTGRESEFGELWDRLQEIERAIGEVLNGSG